MCFRTSAACTRGWTGWHSHYFRTRRRRTGRGGPHFDKGACPAGRDADEPNHQEQAGTHSPELREYPHATSIDSSNRVLG
jgi:hypothetical protein